MHTRKHLVILPGWSNDSDTLWQQQIAHLTELYDVQTLVVSTESNASDMAREVLRQAPESFVLLGHSLGGFIAQHVALQAPQRVEQLILVSTFAGPLPEQQRTFFKEGVLEPLLNGTMDQHWPELNRGCVHPARAQDEALMNAMAAGQKLSREGLLNQTQVLMKAQDISEQLPAIQIPTFILYGRQDLLFTLSMQQLLEAKLPQATLHIIENCGHMPSLEHPQLTTELLLSWLAAVARQPSLPPRLSTSR